MNGFYQHHLVELLRLSGLKSALEAKAKGDAAFERNWNTVLGWKVDDRYDHTIPEVKARDLHAAVTDPNTGVLTWLKTQW